ncbi:MAG: galactose-1-phosphate uridylyltransferase, partial [Bernardetiaceae bacterium]|nr:galactose-1-phosphate uridylyltransferase [Bernardetiaceae bacterium]
MESNFLGRWEKRWHPLREEWVVYAAHRNARPWTTGRQSATLALVPAYSPECYLCPGNQRVSGQRNPAYEQIYVFDNDHPVVGPQAPPIAPEQALTGGGLYRRERANGLARVLCYSPQHHLALAQLPLKQVINVLLAWQEQVRELATRPGIRSVLVFENKGELCGVSNPHPHCQLYATDFVFAQVAQQLRAAEAHRQATGHNLFAQILTNELADGRRVIFENAGAVAFLPFFARYAFEAMVMPKQRYATLAELPATDLAHLAEALLQLLQAYDRLYQMPFPYVLTVQQAPVAGGPYPEFHLYLHLQPPLRQPGLVKFLAGPELGAGNFMADTLPEEKAAELR